MASKSKKIQKVIDGIRAWNLSSSSSSTKNEIEESLKSDNFKFGNIVQYGFPNDPTCIAYEPVQKLLVIGTKSGSGRIFGRPGVDHQFQQPSNSPIIQIIFLINQNLMFYLDIDVCVHRNRHFLMLLDLETFAKALELPKKHRNLLKHISCYIVLVPFQTFISNETKSGIFLTLCDDDTIHQWNYQSKPVELTHSLQFKREKLTCAYLSPRTHWLYVGTEKGNVLFVNIQKFIISGYVINWNKAIALSQSTHPGSIVQMADNPADSNKLLIGFSTGFLSLWNLREKSAKFRFKYAEVLCGLCWYLDGKNFITCHHGGYLVTWNSRVNQGPLTVIQPHNRDNIDQKIGFEPIRKIVLLTTKSEESIMVFSGGTPKVPNPNSESTEVSSSFPSVTVMKDKRLTILQMDYPVIDFAQLCDSCSQNSFTDPIGIAILLQNDLMVIDLLSPNYPSFENPYPIDLHVSPVTCLHYISDCPGDFVASLYTAKSRIKRPVQNKSQGSMSVHEWPINGGQWGSLLNPHSEMIITGHADGSIRFWEATGTSLTSLYKFRISTYLEKMIPCTDSSHIIDCNKSDSTQSTPTLSGNNTSTAGNNVCNLVDDCGRPCGLEHSLINANVTPLNEENQVAISHIQLCPDSRKLMLAGKYFATILSFTKRDVISDVPVLDNAVVYELQEEAELATEDFGMNKQAGLPHQPLSLTSCQDKDFRVFIGVKSGLIKWCPGYQPDLVCRMGSYSKSPPSIISAIGFNANYGIMAFGNDQGIIVVDFVQKISLLSSGTPDLYGSNDPYNRVSWSPSNRKDDIKSPSYETQNPSNGNSTTAASSTSPGATDQPADNSSSKTSSNRSAFISKTELKRAKSQETAHFSRSCSSSTSSLENINCETIKSIAFVETYSKKGDSTPKPCLWIGTSLGSIIVINLNIPDLRTTQPVIVSPSGTVYRLRGSILSISFLDSGGDLLVAKTPGCTTTPDTKLPSSNSTGSNSSINNNNNQKDNNNAISAASPTPITSKKMNYTSKSSTVSSSNSSFGFVGVAGSCTIVQSDVTADPIMDCQFAVLCSEKNSEVIALPSQSQLFKIKITETSVVLKANVITVKSSPCLVVFLANGHLMAFSLPSLRLLMDLDNVLSENWDESALCIANHGLLAYMSSVSEMDKASFSAELTSNIKSAQGDLYNQREMPSPPKKGFFEALFNNSSQLDLDELFGEASSGKASTTTTTLITPNKMETAQQKAGLAQSEIAKARMAALERGEKLSEAELKTQEMLDHAKAFGKNASLLAAKYEKKDKRWGLPF